MTINLYKKGLIKEAVLISIGLFFLARAGLEFNQLTDTSFWINVTDNLKATLVQFWEYLKTIIK